MTEEKKSRGGAVIAVPTAEPFKRVSSLAAKACKHFQLQPLTVSGAAKSSAEPLRVVVVDVSYVSAKSGASNTAVFEAIKLARENDVPIVAVTRTPDDVPAEMDGQLPIRYETDDLKALASPLSRAIRDAVNPHAASSSGGSGSVWSRIHRGWWIGGGVAAVAFFALAFVLFTGDPHSSQFGLANVIHGTLPYDRELFDAKLTELKERTSPIPASRNAALVYDRVGKKLYDATDTEVSVGGKRVVVSSIIQDFLGPNPPSQAHAMAFEGGRDEQIHAMREWFQTIEGDLRELSAATRLPECRWVIDWDAPDVISELIPGNIFRLIGSTRVLLGYAKMAALDGRWDEAIQAWTDLLVLSQRVGRAGWLINVLVDLAIAEMTFDEVAWIANRGAAPLEILQRLDRMLVENYAVDADRSSVVYQEYVFLILALKQVQQDPNAAKNMLSRGANMMALGPAAEMGTRYYKRLAELAARPYHEAYDDFLEFEKLVISIDDPTSPNANPFLAILMPNFVNVLLDAMKGEARHIGARVVLAVEMEQRQAGNYPATLPNTVPTTDPFTNRPMIYRRTPTGYLLYSTGPNRTNNGGRRDRDNSQADVVIMPLGQILNPGERDDTYDLNLRGPYSWKHRPRGRTSAAFAYTSGEIPRDSEFSVEFHSKTTPDDLRNLRYLSERFDVVEIILRNSPALESLESLAELRTLFPRLHTIRFDWAEWLDDARLAQLADLDGITHIEIGMALKSNVTAQGIAQLRTLRSLRSLTIKGSSYELRNSRADLQRLFASITFVMD